MSDFSEHVAIGKHEMRYGMRYEANRTEKIWRKGKSAKGPSKRQKYLKFSHEKLSTHANGKQTVKQT